MIWRNYVTVTLCIANKVAASITWTLWLAARNCQTFYGCAYCVARYQLWPGVCISLAGIVSKRVNGSSCMVFSRGFHRRILHCIVRWFGSDNCQKWGYFPILIPNYPIFRLLATPPSVLSTCPRDVVKLSMCCGFVANLLYSFRFAVDFFVDFAVQLVVQQIYN